MYLKPLAVGFASAAIVFAVESSAQNRRPMRFQIMDTHHDGVITRDEWQGTDQ